MHLVMSMSYRVVLLEPSARSSASIVMACAGQTWNRQNHSQSVEVWDAYSFAELAGNAALFARRISSQGMLATEPGRDRTLHELARYQQPGLEVGKAPGLCGWAANLFERVIDGVSVESSVSSGE